MTKKYFKAFREHYRIFAIYSLCGIILFGQFAPALAQTTEIKPDWRTDMNIEQFDNMYDITTNTTRGANAYNSFHRFDVGSEATVNLRLPDSTNNLINLINDNKASEINGIVNSYKNGQIGGNVFFLNPNGILIGEQGVINTGTLSLATPTQDFMKKFDFRNLNSLDAPTKELLEGSFPISASGIITVKGKVNARNRIELVGHNVSVANSGQLRITPEFVIPFSDIVNVSDVNTGTGVTTLPDGSIRIIGSDEVHLAGTVATNRSHTDNKDTQAGSLVVRSDNKVDMNGALLSTRVVGNPAKSEKLRTDDSTGDSGRVFIQGQHVNLEDTEILTFAQGENSFRAGNIEIATSYNKQKLLGGYRTGIELQNSRLDAGVYQNAAKRTTVEQYVTNHANRLRAGNVSLTATDGDNWSGLDYWTEKSARITMDEASVLAGKDISLTVTTASGYDFNKDDLENFGFDLDPPDRSNYSSDDDYKDAMEQWRNQLLTAAEADNEANNWRADMGNYLKDELESLLSTGFIASSKSNSAKSVIDVQGVVSSTNDVLVSAMALTGMSLCP